MIRIGDALVGMRTITKSVKSWVFVCDLFFFSIITISPSLVKPPPLDVVGCFLGQFSIGVADILESICIGGLGRGIT